MQVCNACNFKHTITNNYFAIVIVIYMCQGELVYQVSTTIVILNLKLRLFSLPNTLNLKAIGK